RIGQVVFDVSTLIGLTTLALLGVQLIMFGVFARAYAAQTGLLPVQAHLQRFLHRFSLLGGVVAGLLIIGVGISIFGLGLATWGEVGFGSLDHQMILRVVVPGMFFVLCGTQIVFASFVLSLLGIRRVEGSAGTSD
ncbi:MAG TPA: hypothetical protein VLL77_01485, partial [Anaerolineales bacterium]|nr:hypothetical protein [Anaerolineales bacterium]